MIETDKMAVDGKSIGGALIVSCPARLGRMPIRSLLALFPLPLPPIFLHF